MENGQQPQAEDRKKRVQRLKKMIILSIVIGIVVPWVACAVLFVYVTYLGDAVQGMDRRLEEVTKLLSQQNGQLDALRKERGEEAATQKALNEELLRRLEALEEEKEAEAQAAREEPEVSKHLHKVYLTFDDGPSIYTNEILDILKQYDVKATFFVLGKESEADQEAMRRIVAEGHSLGMHSYTHQYDQIYASGEAFAEDFQKIRDYLFQVTGVKSNIYRFPGGSSNSVSNVDVHVFIDYLREQNVTYYDWNIASGDAAKVSLSAETILENATKGLEKNETSVILFHDAASRRTTVDALPMVIERIRGMENTVLLPITDDSEPVQHVKAQD